MTSLSTAVGAVDAEIRATERRLASLKEIRRLVAALEDVAPPRRAAAATDAAPRTSKKATKPPGHKTALTIEDVTGPARELLAHGPVTSAEIHRAVGRWPTARTKAIVEGALEQIGAIQAGVAQGGATRWAMPLEARISELKDKLGEWSPDEWQYQLRKRFRLELPISELRDALATTNGVAA